MFSADEEKLGRARLTTLGVPASYHDALMVWAAESLAPQSRTALFAVSALVVVIGALFGWAVWTLGAQIPTQGAYTTARAVGATLVMVNPGFGFLIAFLPALMLGSYVITLACGAIMGPKRKRAARALMLIEKNPSMFRKGAAGTALRHSTTAETFLNAYFNAIIFRMVAPVLAVFLLGLAVTAVELRSYVVAGPNGVVHARMWPPYSTATYTWDQAASIVVGCNSTDDGDNIIFDVTFPDGQTFSIGHARIGRKQRIPALEEIDRLLPLSVARKLWNWLGRDAMAARCMSTWGDTVPNGYKRLEHLLRTNS